MPYLMNARCRIERLVGTDDEYGGYSPTGTIVVSDMEFCRLDMYMPNQALIRQLGLESEKTYTIILHYNRQNPTDVRENDIIILTFPSHHPMYDFRFRVRGVSYEATHPSDPRGIIECTVTRWERGRTSSSI